jgi:glycosyltransferase involved in cell wall biosynthesis
MRGADLLIAMTGRDLAGLERLPGRHGALALWPPFLADPGPELSARPPRASGEPVELLAVAMMRPGFKLDSYRLLAEALTLLPRGAWRLAVLGDGPAAGDVARLMGEAGAKAGASIQILGAADATGVRAAMDAADIFVWPGVREPYGMVYLEAASRGMPAVALRQGGVPDMVRHDVTGLLAPGDTAHDYASALATLIADPGRRAAMGAAARRFATQERGLATAAATLDALLTPLISRQGAVA